MWVSLFFFLAIMTFIIPFFPAVKEWLSKKDALPLWRVSTNEDVNYFSSRFRVYADRELSLAFVNDAYQIILPDTINQYFSGDKEYQKFDKKIYAPESLQLPDNLFCSEEIYGKADISIGKDSHIRAALASDYLELDDGCTVDRWLHAKNVLIGDGCRLFGRVTAENKIEIQTSCEFSRLHAPVIEFGALNSGQDHLDHHRQWIINTNDLTRITTEFCQSGRLIIDGDYVLPSNVLLETNLIVKGKLDIGQGAVVMGDIKTYGNVNIEDHVSIKGAIVSQSSITVGDWCRISGPLIADEFINLGFGVTVGSYEVPSTITCEKFSASYSVLVYGAINSRSTIEN